LRHVFLGEGVGHDGCALATGHGKHFRFGGYGRGLRYSIAKDRHWRLLTHLHRMRYASVPALRRVQLLVLPGHGDVLAPHPVHPTRACPILLRLTEHRLHPVGDATVATGARKVAPRRLRLTRLHLRRRLLRLLDLGEISRIDTRLFLRIVRRRQVRVIIHTSIRLLRLRHGRIILLHARHVWLALSRMRVLTHLVHGRSLPIGVYSKRILDTVRRCGLIHFVICLEV